MTIDGLSDAEVQAILTRTRRIAVVGASDRPERPSYGVLAWLVAQGYDVTPVNPALAGRQIHGRIAVASLAEAVPLDLVDIFRAADAVGPVVDEAVAQGAHTVWMQLGVINIAAAAVARAAGLAVVMDRCPKIEAARLGARGGAAPPPAA